MTALNEIIAGFDTVRAEGVAFIIDVSTSTPFQLIGVERALALSRSADGRVWPKVCSGARHLGNAFFVLWQRGDGTYGAMATLGDGALIEGSQNGLRLAVRDSRDAPKPTAAFAVAADPFVAADFCRAAATKAMAAVGIAGNSTAFQVDLARGRIDPAEAVYAAATSAIWSRPVVTSTDEPAAEGWSTFCAAARDLFASPVTITRDRLFIDSRTEPRLLKAFAHKGRDGVLGLFHCQHQTTDAPLTDTWRPDDVEGLGGEQFAAWHAIERKLFIIGRGIEESITLPPRGVEIIHLVPILQNVAPLGLIDRLNASAAMTRMGSRKCRLADGGTVGWYAAKRPSHVTLDGTSVAFDYDQTNGLLTFEAQAGAPHDSEVTL